METLTKSTTHTQIITELDMNNQESVCIILGISNDFYCEDQFRAYEHFTLVCCSESSMRAVRLSKAFRGFWLNEWAQRNELFLRMVERHQREDRWMKPDGKAYDAYLWFHSTQTLINDKKFMDRFEAIVERIKKVLERQKRKEAKNAIH